MQNPQQPPTSLPRELRERFSQTSTPKNDDFHVEVRDVLGIRSEEMKDTITTDISAMLKKGYSKAMEGYILCLSRIINHDTAWQCIIEAFRQNNEDVPKKYYGQFGKK